MLKSVFALAVLASSSLVLGQYNTPSTVHTDSLGPWHASCKLTWAMDSDCTTSKTALVSAVSAMNNTNCGESEKCFYSLIKDADQTLTIIHETPKAHYKDDVTLQFVASGAGCTINGASTSETWYAVLDQGTNYCNMHNLVVKSGLTFKEDVSDDVCTQFSSANCDKY